MMLYEKLYDKLAYLMKNTGMLHEEQIRLMFSGIGKETLDWGLSMLVKDRIVSYDRESRLYSYKGRKFSPAVQRDITDAAWVVASQGDRSVRQLWVCETPLCLVFITEDGAIYDVSTVRDGTPPSLLLLYRQAFREDGDVEGGVMHIAFTESERTGETLRKYGFDGYCMRTGSEVMYYAWE